MISFSKDGTVSSTNVLTEIQSILNIRNYLHLYILAVYRFLQLLDNLSYFILKFYNEI